NGDLNFKSGGRLFRGFWETLPKRARLLGITIEGEGVVELDYSQLNPPLAYAMVGHLPPRRNRINEQFSARLIEMLEAPAYRALSRSAHLVIARIEVELGHHGGNDNGRLPVTTENFVAYGIHRASVAPAIREAVALGFIR